MAEPDWRDVYQAEKAKKAERWKQMRQQLGQTASDAAIEKAAEKAARQAVERVLRDDLHKPRT